MESASHYVQLPVPSHSCEKISEQVPVTNSCINEVHA